MSGSRTGTPSIVKKAGEITRLYSTLGAVDLATKTSNEFLVCVQGLVACYNILRQTDDWLLKIDSTAPFGPEDLTGP